MITYKNKFETFLVIEVNYIIDNVSLKKKKKINT